MSLYKALEFFDRVMECTPEERIAVGSDHWVWVLEEARKAVDHTKELEATVFLLHNPHTGEECGCPVCNNQRKEVSDE